MISKKKLFDSDYVLKQTNKDLKKHIYHNILKNIKNFKFGNSIIKLRNKNKNKKNSIIVAAGPSIKNIDQTKILKKYSKYFNIVACDSALFYLLKNNIVPDLVISCDPDEKRILRWFGDTNLTVEDLKKDDYFARQDLDSDFKDQIQNNKKVIKKLDKYKGKLKIALCTSVSKKVFLRIKELKFKIFWWNPYLDDENSKSSLTKKIYNINKFPLINTGGNVGTSSWNITDTVLNSSYNALVGFDFSYYINLPIKSTQYYDSLNYHFGKKGLKNFYKKIYNPHIKKYFYTDHVYHWYKNCLIEMLEFSENKTFNCTGGGILFEGKIFWSSLKNFCKSFKNG